MTRRDCMRFGLGGLFGLGLVDLLRMRGLTAVGAGRRVARPTSCILIWMDGGPTHYETFDPKPDAPKEIRGSYEPISRSEEHTSELQSLRHLVCRLLLEK